MDGGAKRRQMPQYIHDGPVPLREGVEDRVDFPRCQLYKRGLDRGNVKRRAKSVRKLLVTK